MKIRHGFVTNSSSTSYLVGFRQELRSTKDILNLIDCEQVALKMRQSCYDKAISAIDVANFLFRLLSSPDNKVPQSPQDRALLRIQGKLDCFEQRMACYPAATQLVENYPDYHYHVVELGSDSWDVNETEQENAIRTFAGYNNIFRPRTATSDEVVSWSKGG